MAMHAAGMGIEALRDRHQRGKKAQVRPRRARHPANTIVPGSKASADQETITVNGVRKPEPQPSHGLRVLTAGSSLDAESVRDFAIKS